MGKLIQAWKKTCGPALLATASPTAAQTSTSTAQAAPAACTPGWVSQRRTHYLYDDAGRFIGEYDTVTGGWQDTVWFNGQPVAVVQADGVYYVHADHLATPRSIVRAANGAEIWRWDSEPFGATSPTNPNPASGGLVYNVRFPGQYLDLESGVAYNGMRDYLSATGRYLQADPIGLRGGLTRYTYVGGNPLSYTDPAGLMGGSGADSGRLETDWGRFVRAWWGNVQEANSLVFGLAAPTGMTLMTGRVAANSIGAMTFFDIALGLYNGTLGVVVGDGMSVAVTGAAFASAVTSAALNTAVVNGAFEVGIAIGSVPIALSASLVPVQSCRP